MAAFFRILVGCLVGQLIIASISFSSYVSIETVTFQIGITLACCIVLNAVDWTRSLKHQKPPVSDIRREFRFVHNVVRSHIENLFPLQATPSFL